MLEGSNVNVVRTMVELMISLRAYEAHQRTVQAIDQTAGQAAGDLGRA
jgi:flagellar basal body rod protein FlgG